MSDRSHLDVGYFFPTAIGLCTDLLPECDLIRLQEASAKLSDCAANSENTNWLSGGQSPYNTMNTHNIVDDNNFSALLHAVGSKVKEFALHHADTGNYVSDHAWLNVYSANQYQEAHTHSAPYIYSAVFFVNASDQSGLFVAQAPYTHAQVESNHAGSNILTDTKRWYQPKTNMLLVFKSTLSHYTTPNRNDDDVRISIAFNFKPV